MQDVYKLLWFDASVRRRGCAVAPNMTTKVKTNVASFVAGRQYGGLSCSPARAQKYVPPPALPTPPHLAKLVAMFRLESVRPFAATWRAPDRWVDVHYAADRAVRTTSGEISSPSSQPCCASSSSTRSSCRTTTKCSPRCEPLPQEHRPQHSLTHRRRLYREALHSYRGTSRRKSLSDCCSGVVR